MAAVVPYNTLGPDTYDANVLIPGAVLVEPDATTGKVKVATAATVKCLGVALYSAAPQGSIQGATAYGEVVIDMSTLQTELAVGWQGTYKLKATGAIAFGDPVICAANGTVASAAAPAAGTQVGRCVEPLGIAGGAIGLIRLSL
jgi:hypothetical protein